MSSLMWCNVQSERSNLSHSHRVVHQKRRQHYPSAHARLHSPHIPHFDTQSTLAGLFTFTRMILHLKKDDCSDIMTKHSHTDELQYLWSPLEEKQKQEDYEVLAVAAQLSGHISLGTMPPRGLERADLSHTHPPVRRLRTHSL